MLRSLEHIVPVAPVETDVIIIGAGLAGMFLADGLVARGLRVVVLESGGKTQETEIHPLNAVELEGDCYQGATYGRYRCLGGTSSRWGGALLPYLPDDLQYHPCGWHRGWGIEPSDLNATLPAAEAAFGLMPDGYEGVPEGDSDNLLVGFLPRQPKWPSFRNRNTVSLFKHRIHLDPCIEVWTDATVVGIDLEYGRVRGVTAQSNKGQKLFALAPSVVIAAGAVETTRILLLMNRAYDNRLFPADSPLGQGFHDHLSAPIASLQDIVRREIIRLFSFRFVKGGMRNLRFELAPAVRQKMELSAAFLHVTFTRDPSSGFEGLREALQAAQRRAVPSAKDIARILCDLPWFARAVWWRSIEKRVYPPSGSDFELQLVTEQAPEPTQRITLAAENLDVFGQPKARIMWKVTDADVRRFLTVATLAVERWHSGRLGNYAKLEARSQAAIERSLREGGGIYHPAGTTRIGKTASSGVVDASLKVHGVPGLWALATSVFPSIGGSSPSLALVQLALRMADEIAYSSGFRQS